MSNISTVPKPTPDAFQWLIRYHDAVGTKIDAKSLATAMGTKYKAAWDGINRAKKELTEMGYVATAPDAASAEPTAQKAGNKRKTMGEEAVEDEEVAAMPKGKKRLARSAGVGVPGEDNGEEGGAVEAGKKRTCAQGAKKKEVTTVKLENEEE